MTLASKRHIAEMIGPTFRLLSIWQRISVRINLSLQYIRVVL